MHCYSRDGKPCHEQPTKSKNAKNLTRATTIADMKRLDLIPSVTTILDIFENKGLERWKFGQITKACFDSCSDIAATDEPSWEMMTSFESYDDYHSKMIEEAFKPSKDALDVGSDIHDELESFYKTGTYNKDKIVMINDEPVRIAEFVEPTIQCLIDSGIEVTASELTVVNPKFGVAGRLDFKCTRNGIGQGVGDFKTCSKVPTKAYQFHPTQISAYYTGEFNDFPKKKDDAFGLNVYISKEKIGDVRPFFYDWAELKKEWRVYENALQVWQYLKNYQFTK